MHSGQAHSIPPVRSHLSTRVTCKVMGCWPLRDTWGWGKIQRVMSRDREKGVLLGSAPCSAEGHIPSLSTAFYRGRGVHGPRLVIFGTAVIRLHEENNHFSLPVSQWVGLASFNSSLGWALVSKMPRDESSLCWAHVQRFTFLVGPVKQSSTDQTPGWLQAIKP